MKIVDKDNILVKRENCYQCYSLNLNDFLQNEKKILPVRVSISEKTNKNCYWFIMTDSLDVALKEWTARKKEGNLYKPKVVRNYESR